VLKDQIFPVFRGESNLVARFYILVLPEPLG